MENHEIIKEILKDIQTQLNELNKKQFKSESEQLDLLFTALSKAQAEIEIAKTDSSNPFFKSKYADFSQIVKASRPYLAKNGLAIIQRVLTNGNGLMYLFTRLCHSSGQWIESKMPINPPKADIQSIGSYISYLRRYNWASMVGVAAAEEDDDGEQAMLEDRQNKKLEYISVAQIKELEKKLNSLAPIEKENLLKWCQVDAIQFIPKFKYGSINVALEEKIKKVNKYE